MYVCKYMCDWICENRHSDKAKFSLPINSFINKLTKHHCATTTSKLVCFLRRVKHTPVLGWH